MPHNVSGLNWGTWGKGEDPDLTAGETYANTFNEPGYYPYSCTLHYNMVGLLIVGDPASAEASSSKVDTPAVAHRITAQEPTPPLARSRETGPGGEGSMWAILTGAGVVALGLVGGGALLRARRR